MVFSNECHRMASRNGGLGGENKHHVDMNGYDFSSSSGHTHFQWSNCTHISTSSHTVIASFTKMALAVLKFHVNIRCLCRLCPVDPCLWRYNRSIRKFDVGMFKLAVETIQQITNYTRKRTQTNDLHSVQIIIYVWYIYTWENESPNHFEVWSNSN